MAAVCASASASSALATSGSGASASGDVGVMYEPPVGVLRVAGVAAPRRRSRACVLRSVRFTLPMPSSDVACLCRCGCRRDTLESVPGKRGGAPGGGETGRDGIVSDVALASVYQLGTLGSLHVLQQRQSARPQHVH